MRTAVLLSSIPARRHCLAVAWLTLGLAFSAATIAGDERTAATSGPGTTLPALEQEQVSAAFNLLREFLVLPNVATQAADIQRVLARLDEELSSRGFATRRLPTGGNDLLLASLVVPAATRTVLFYVHADGQPVDATRWFQDSPWTPELKARSAGATSIDGNPADWQALPWEMLERERIDPDWRVYARSASDSKGPIVQFLSAVSLLQHGGISPRFNLKVIVDTEEEMGSPRLASALQDHRDELAADAMLILDGPPHTSGAPTLAFGARGIAKLTLTTYGPRVSQHSGHWGNYAPNPALRLAQLLASMKDADGRVTIPGFYDGVEIDDQARAILDAVPEDIPALHARLGIAAPDRVGASPQEALQYPSLNIRGMSSGWVGPEARTIVPAVAVAEIDIRLVKESDPDRLLGLIRRHIEGLGYHVLSGRDPTDPERLAHPRLIRIDAEVEYRAFRSDIDSFAARWLVEAIETEFGQKPVIIRTMGGSVPVSPFVDAMAIPAIQVGTVNPDNNQHSPNENLRVGDFLRGIRMIAAILATPVPDPDTD